MDYLAMGTMHGMPRGGATVGPSNAELPLTFVCGTTRLQVITTIVTRETIRYHLIPGIQTCKAIAYNY